MDLLDIGVKPAKKKQFENKGIFTVEDLLAFIPRKYMDYRSVTGLLPSDQVSVVRLKVDSVDSKNAGKNPYIVARGHEDLTGKTIQIFWFHCMWRYSEISSFTGKYAVAAGKAEYSEQYETYTIFQPSIFGSEALLGIYPVYKSIAGMSQDYFAEKMEAALRSDAIRNEILPTDVLSREGEIPMQQAFRYIHRPRSLEEAEKGMNRVLLNDLLYFAVNNELNKRQVSNGSQYNVKTLTLLKQIQNKLPFHLTEDQESTVKSMVELARDGRRLNSLIQGDVGCGKTICAALTAAAFIGSGYQVVMMAPTQVLAKQHLETMQDLFQGTGVNIAYLDSAMKKKDRRDVIRAIGEGEADFVIGTHSCIAKDVQYRGLALTIVDEEHKFGVNQRAAIIDKAAGGVHSITMSATPIPRSLAQVIYGDGVQLYTIHSMPQGRKPVITGIAKDQMKVYRFVKSQVDKRHQVYIVCPLIEQSEKSPDILSVEEVSNAYAKTLSPYGIRIATLTGKNTKQETEDTIKAFASGDIDVLIATSVIEVGVNVPNATVMVVSNAERFGLSALHQLRGRVGRGQDQSYCVLQSPKMTEKAEARLNVLCRTTNGFEIAEADLQLRGAGDFLGTQQSGDNKYVSLMIANPDRYKTAQRLAKELIDKGFGSCSLMQRIYKERIETLE